MSQQLKQEIDRRRTFAIISHPDAGKTTLTEKLLLFGGAIRDAGTVKAKKTGKFATSDWMDIEKQRGISVTSSVMQFDYDGKRVNILDTPGHQDFSEDTYRTLMAVDSAVMIIDVAKGIEAQTIKLFKVCRMRGIPIFTFINKMDRQGKEPLELMEELEEVLGIESYAMNWPIGMGKEFLGIYDRYNNRVEPFRSETGRFMELDEDGQLIGDHPMKETSYYEQALEDIELLNEAGNDFSAERIANGELTPVFFGSALANFGVETFLETYLQFAPPPQGRVTQDEEVVNPVEEPFSGFVFKIQANMNPAHRDRIAFLRIVTGKFERGMNVTLARTGKSFKVAQSTQFLADDRETVAEAVAGDIIGLYDVGNYQIGDTVTVGKKLQYEALPQFTPELFMKVTAKNVMKSKHFHKGILQLVQEGAIQYYKTLHLEEVILGAVGQLQFEVFEHRMKNEYNVEVRMEPVGTKVARWIENEQDVKESMSGPRSMLVKDRHDNLVFLFENEFATRWFQDKNPDIKLYSLL
ncbi:peptide chain release factor 3 [Planococcus lenghuensis]|uniref:Peptide chain release factor 3 n=1 Tax=Planococcus lenghuensis TaxID=2213202 RepID=A0A1Q2L0C3_9BACL|nr:peptide chain release factor 3 [Planococcus lenghuensis]AQQ53881.1 peptide chain release factor 3 [Planococcus lenghuensis]